MRMLTGMGIGPHRGLGKTVMSPGTRIAPMLKRGAPGHIGAGVIKMGKHFVVH